MKDALTTSAAKVLRHLRGRTRASALHPVRDADTEIAVEQRSLTDYDTALGVDLDGGFAS